MQIKSCNWFPVGPPHFSGIQAQGILKPNIFHFVLHWLTFVMSYLAGDFGALSSVGKITWESLSKCTPVSFLLSSVRLFLFYWNGHLYWIKALEYDFGELSHCSIFDSNLLFKVTLKECYILSDDIFSCFLKSSPPLGGP